ncbi:MAG: hypothetical protein KKD30_02095 [Gammaproteobacteria bacterium]|nr:hypothetical protein [Gammaproteobacteria bacterium]MBU0882461.1 hypothetical protein [Gammaproteobacteria bacterium]MBU1858741.1 hypothetical protein [Gammaproteobacteria bacterium]
MGKSIQIGFLGLALIGLTGCDMVEQSAQQLADKAEQAALEVARDTLDSTLKELNKQVDEVQQSANEWLPPAEPQEDQPSASPQHEQPADEPATPLSSSAVEA